MGVVYEAEQISLRRRVALKVLPFAAAIDPRRLQRFKTEALAAAHVQHEKIVPVHAVGCERGVHYYAMQFIEGQSLAALIGELRALRDERRDGAAVTEAAIGRPESPSGGGATSAATTISRERSADRLRYFDRVAGLGRQAALALEHAHQAGIVHRDVKPGNLLLDLRGQLWVTDFGLAQVTGDVGLTITGEMLGTLRYASPEQVLARRGIVDHRSDVYSLGATLYELLTLRPPFDGRDRNALIRQIADDEPASPRSLEPSIPAELETIVLKALRKEPADRYATAQEMADDLQRFLDGRPILARRPTPSERLRAWSRRHPAIVGSGVAALVLLSAASLVSTAVVRREQAKTLAEQRKAEAAYRREHQRAEEAEARFRLARRAVDELIRASEEELAHRPGMEGLRKRLLGSALAYYREFIDRAAERPGCAGRAARHHAAGRDDPRRPGGAPRRRAALSAHPADRPRRSTARRRPEGEGGRALRPCRRAGRTPSATPPACPPGRARPDRPGAGPRQRGGGRRDPDAPATRSGSARSPSSRRGRPPFGSRRSSRRSASRPGSASGSARSRTRPSSARSARCNREGPSKTPAGRRWGASSPSSPRSRPDAGTSWPAIRSGAR